MATDSGNLVTNGKLFIGMGLMFVLGAMFSEIGRPEIPVAVGFGSVLVGVGLLLVGYYRKRGNQGQIKAGSEQLFT
ncbi:MAG: hypothetical protein JXB30_00940 [Anaerolineae bacterium]|nr:hypothetical protein [Anaerolineae bacterium]